MTGKISIILIVFLLVTGCKRDPKPSNTIDRKTFINVLVDIHIAESMYLEKKGIKLDSLQSKSLYFSVLRKYDISDEKMAATTLYYSRNPKEYDKIFTEVLSRMTAKLDELQGKKKAPKKK